MVESFLIEMGARNSYFVGYRRDLKSLKKDFALKDQTIDYGSKIVKFISSLTFH
jgi:hypothetical protein